MRKSHSFQLLTLLILLTSVSCRFSDIFSDIPPEPTDSVINRDGLKFVPKDLPEAQLGVAYETRINIENVRTFVGQFMISKAKLPPGLTLERVEGENSAKIVGTPLEAGNYKFNLLVYCLGTNTPGQQGEKEYTLIVHPKP